MQLVGEPACGREPPVRRLGRVNAIGGGCAARQYGDPHEPSESHRRKPFLQPSKLRKRSAFPRTEPRAAPDSPSTRRFQAPVLTGNPPISFFSSARGVINQI